MYINLNKQRKLYLIDQKVIYYSLFIHRLCTYFIAIIVNLIMVCCGHTAQKPIFSATQPSTGKILDLNLQPTINKNNRSSQALVPESHAEKFYPDEQIHKKSKQDVTIHMAPHQRIQPFESAANAGSPLHILQNPSRPRDAINPKQLIEQPPSIGLKKTI